MKKALAIVLTMIILIIIYSRIDLRKFGEYFLNLNWIYFFISLTFFVPCTLISAYRWKLMLKQDCDIPLGLSLKLFLAGSSVNSIVPSKLGDMTKAYFIRDRIDPKRAFNTVLVEKILDVSSLCLVLLIGILLIKITNEITLFAIIFSGLIVTFTAILFIINYSSFRIFKNPKNRGVLKKLISVIVDSQNFINILKKDKGRFYFIIFISIFLWFLHMTQIYFFFLSLNHPVQLKLVFGLVPVAIFIGLIPVTVAGMGTRDGALILLFAPYAPASLMAGVGILCSMRYWIPSLVGLPFLHALVAKR